MSYISCKDVALGYTQTPVIEHVSFEVEKGDYLCIVGENGAGKSTLVKTLLKLIKPLSGKLEFSSELTGIGYLPQQAENKDFPATVEEIVLSGTLTGKRFYPFYNAKDKAIAKANMEKLGIYELKKKSFKTLSGGLKQRALMARALCATEDILLLDEPTAGLDPVVTTELYKVIKDLSDEGVTIIMVTHDIPSAHEFASKVLHLGKKNFYGTAEEYKNSDIGKAFVQMM